MWNPFNKVVQCHNCGMVYEPKGLTGNAAIDVKIVTKQQKYTQGT